MSQAAGLAGAARGERGSALEVLRVFLVLGLSCFGGPVAHLGYFRREFVEKRAWLTAEDYASLLALCQFLPGPASSQTGFCIGLKRAGPAGALAAWTGFTLPSAILMALIAHFATAFEQHGLARGVLHGLELAAVAVVAQAVWNMARSLCPDTPRRALAVLGACIVLLGPGTGGQLLVLLLGAVLGRLALAPAPQPEKLGLPGKRRNAALGPHLPALLCLLAFAALLAASFETPATGPWALSGAFYRAGALVFGGGHVVLPLLREAVVAPGWVPQNLFIAGYGAAQAMPGPLFTVAAYLGAVSTTGPGGAAGATLATAAIFLPGLLIAAGTLPYWQKLRHLRGITAAMQGINAAVVGLLGAALVNLLTLNTIQSIWDLPIAATGLILLTRYRTPPIAVVALCAAAGAILSV